MITNLVIDQLLSAVDNGEEAFAIPDGDISGLEPAVFGYSVCCGGGVVEVSLGYE